MSSKIQDTLKDFNLFCPKDIGVAFKFIGTVVDVNDKSDPLVKAASVPGGILYSKSDDASYVYTGGGFEPIDAPAKDTKEPIKIRRRSNCRNCGAPLPDTSGSRVKCKYCDTVQSIDKDDQEVLEGPVMAEEYHSVTSTTYMQCATSPTFTIAAY